MIELLIISKNCKGTRSFFFSTLSIVTAAVFNSSGVWIKFKSSTVKSCNKLFFPISPEKTEIR